MNNGKQLAMAILIVVVYTMAVFMFGVLYEAHTKTEILASKNQESIQEFMARQAINRNLLCAIAKSLDAEVGGACK